MGDRKYFLILVLGLLFLSICGFVYHWLFQPPFKVIDLSLPEEMFPEDVMYSPMKTTRDSLPAIDAGNQTVYWSQMEGLATFNIERLPTIGLAKRAYLFYANLGFYPLNPKVSYRSSVADEFKTGCGISEFGGYRCVLRARYREYVTTSNVVIDESMTIEDFEEIVKYIDSQFQARLYGKSQP